MARGWLARLARAALIALLWLGVPLLLLAAAEGGLRAADYGHPTRFLLHREIDGVAHHAVNERFYFQFFLGPADPVSPYPMDCLIPVEKAPGAFRVFVVGGSAAQGWMYLDQSPARQLETLLRARWPGVPFEVYDIAYYGMNSHAMRAAVEACATLQPDLFVVYLGNNEVVGPFSAMRLLGMRNLPAWAMRAFIRAHIALSDLRLMQWMQARVGRAAASELAGIRWGLDAPIHDLDDPRLARIHALYEANLEAIVRAARRGGAEVALCTLAGNLRAWRPSVSQNRPGLDHDARTAWEAAYAAGKAAQARGDFAAARTDYEAALGMDDQHADLRFRLGQCLWELGDPDGARPHFLAAVHWNFGFDLARAPINEAVRRVAARHAGRGARLVDVEAAMAADSPHATPGLEHFFDRMHFRPEGAHVLARAVAQSMEDAPRPGAPGGPRLDFEACAARLGYGPAVRHDALRAVIDYLERLGQDQPVAPLREDLARLAAAARDTVADWEAAVALAPDDRAARFRLVEALLRHGRADEAARHAGALAAAHPRHWRSKWALAETAARAGNLDEAAQRFDALVAAHPGEAQSHHVRAEFQWSIGDRAAALAGFQQARTVDPRFHRAWAREADMLADNGDHAAAERAYCAALPLAPGNDALYTGLERVQPDPAARARRFQALAATRPHDALPRYYLGKSLIEAGEAADGALQLRDAAARQPALAPRVAALLGEVDPHPGAAD